MAQLPPTIEASKIDVNSQDSVAASLDLFASPPSHTSYSAGAHTIIKPSTNFDVGQFEINIPAVDSQYTQLFSSYLEIGVKITKANGTAFGADAANIGFFPGDNFFHSLFSKMTLSFNNNVVEQESEYAHRAMFYNTYTTTKDQKLHSLQASDGWYNDKGFLKPYADVANEIKTKRKAKCLNSNIYTGRITPFLSLWRQKRDLPPKLQIVLTLDRNKDQIALMGSAENVDGGVKIEIIKAELNVRRVVLNPAVHMAHSNTWNGGSKMLYPINRVKTSFRIIPPNVKRFEVNLQEKGYLPKKIYLGFIKHTSKTGKFMESALRSQHFNINEIEVLVNGFSNQHKYKVDFDKKDVVKAYMGLMETVGTNMSHNEIGPGISVTDYIDNGVTYFGFDFRPDLCSSNNSVHLINTGGIAVNISFAEDTPENISMLVIEELDDLISIDYLLQITNRVGTV